MSGLTCHGCGAPLVKSWKGRDPKWCSEKCRKAQYGFDPCVDCGAKTSSGPANGRDPEPRCNPCATNHYRRKWTPELIVARIQEWAELYGEPPATPDWSPVNARYINDPERASRFEEADGHWPWFNHVHRVFGSWNAAIEAAGFTPRAPHGGGGNGARHRSVRAKAAA